MKRLCGMSLVVAVCILTAHLGSNQLVQFSGTAYAWPEDGKKCAECHSALKPSVKSLKFGQTRLGVPVTQDILITNTGNDDLIIDTLDVTFTGSSFNEFSQTNNCDALIPYLSTCTISVTATPADFGKRLAGLSIPSNYVKANQMIIPLSVDAKPPKIKTKPSTVSFSTTLGVDSTRTLTISNKGLSDLIISGSLTPTGSDAPDFSVNRDLCPPILQGQTCTIEITYHSDVVKTSTAQIVIISNDPVKPSVIVNLKGKTK